MNKEESFEQVVDLIKRCPLFYPALPEGDIFYLAKHLKKVEIKKNDVLFNQGDVSDQVYLLISGSLICVPASVSGQVKSIGPILPYETVGELGVLLNESRSLTVVAESDSELLAFPKEVFLHICQREQHFSEHILKLVAKRSMKMINLISQQEDFKCNLFLCANKHFPVKNFFEALHKENEDINFLYQSPSLRAELELIQASTGVNETVNIMLDKYDESLFEYLQNHEIKFFLLAEDEQRVLDDNNEKILDFFKGELFQLVLLHPKNATYPYEASYWVKKAEFKLYHHIRIDQAKDFQRLARFLAGRPVGLVLGGGGVRCYAHFGVMQALLENNVPIDMIGGTSGGAIIGSGYAFTQDMDKTIKIYDQMVAAMAASVKLKEITWPLTSVFSGKVGRKAAVRIFEHTRIENLALPFFCLSSCLSTDLVYEHTNGGLITALQSSIAIPGLWPPGLIDGRLHYDGGLLNNLPVESMKKLLGPNGIVVASCVTNAPDFSERYAFPKIITLKDALLYKLGFTTKNYKFPNFVESFLRAILITSRQVENENGLMANILVKPVTTEFGTLRFTKGQNKETLIQRGYDAAKSVLEMAASIKNKK